MTDNATREVVLVVDDSPESLNLLTDMLEEDGFTALVARSGESALSLLERVTPGIVLMDAVMPGMDGFEVCARIKQNKSLADIPIIFMTGLSETEHVIRGFRAGGVDYVTKPIIPSELLIRIRTHIANSRLAQSARIALDLSGSTLLAVDEHGRVLWSTPKALAKLKGALGIGDFEDEAWRKTLEGELHAVATQRLSRVPLAQSGGRLCLSFLGQARPHELLIGLSDNQGPSDEALLRDSLALTDRESEVLLWIAQGKSNREIAAILNCSPRTVNKHLEQIFTKLGVENRTSAAMVAMRALANR